MAPEIQILAVAWKKQIAGLGLKSLKIPYIEEEQTTQWPKRKSTKGQTTIDKTYI
jgi:hypothetical protein